MTDSIPTMRPIDHWRGFGSLARMAAAPLGRFVCGRLDDLRAPERYERGLVLVLPGIESESTVNHGVARGLADGGVDHAIEVFDWTTGWPGLFLYHLRAKGWHRRQVKRLVETICAYQDEHLGRPVHLVGHSGGGAMAVLALEQMPAGRSITGAILLAAAISPQHDLRTALEHVERGVWSFYSPLDLMFLAAGTLVFGTLDGKHTIAAGACGFCRPPSLDEQAAALYDAKLHEVRFEIPMACNWNLGGHLGPTNRVFAAVQLAQIIRRDVGESGSQRDDPNSA